MITVITPRNVTLSNGRVVARGSNAKWGAAAYVGGTWIRLGNWIGDNGPRTAQFMGIPWILARKNGAYPLVR
jgi:hypothetical protein